MPNHTIYFKIEFEIISFYIYEKIFDAHLLKIMNDMFQNNQLFNANWQTLYNDVH